MGRQLSIKDSEFLRGNVPMTKEEIRTLVLSKLRLKVSDTALDIGAGTGSVSIAMAGILEKGYVTALEKNPEAIDLIRRNCKKFEMTNLTVIDGEAPRAMANLSLMDKIFIGGSGKNLEAILTRCFDLLKSGGIMAATAITLKTLFTIEKFFKEKPFSRIDIINVSISKYQEKSGMMLALNPIYILSATKE